MIKAEAIVCPYCHRDLKEHVDPSALSTKWLVFWTYLYLPITAIAAVALGFPLNALGSQQQGLHGQGLIVWVFALFQIVVAVGLNVRKLWAWKANWVILLGAFVPAILGGLLQISETGFTPVLLGYFIGVLLIAMIWLWPNCFYFSKRKALFT
jgi:uncharacterized membrane protein YhaH (DUF805 family)